jgi:hypothetical protein
VYCAFSALKILGSDVELIELLDPRHVPSRMGSTVDNLHLILREHGARATSLAGLSEASLRASPDRTRPVITLLA